MTGIDIAAIARVAVRTGLNLAGTAKDTATIYSNTPDAPGTYDPVTDVTTPGTGGASSAVTVEGLLYRTKEQQGSDKTGRSATFLFDAEDDPGLDEGATLTIKGVNWQIDMVEPVPTDAAVILTLRR